MIKQEHKSIYYLKSNLIIDMQTVAIKDGLDTKKSINEDNKLKVKERDRLIEEKESSVYISISHMLLEDDRC